MVVAPGVHHLHGLLFAKMPRSRRTSRLGAVSRSGVEAEIHHKLARFGVSGPGREWILRALHPASEKKSPGLPDESSTFVLRPDFRINSTIMPPPGAGQWDCIMWFPPGDCNAMYWATGPSPVDFTSAVPPNGAQVGVVQLQSVTDSDPLNPYVVQYGGGVQQNVTNVPSLRAAAVRHQYKSVTVEQIAAAVSDQGQVYAGQFSPLLRTVGLVQLSGYDSGIDIPGTDPPIEFGLIAQHYTTVLPADESSLSRMNPDFYQAPSREGVYMPFRLSGPSQPFARSVSGQCVHVTNGGAGFITQDVSLFPVGGILTATTNSLAHIPASDPWPFVVPVSVLHSPDNTVISIPGRQTFDTGFDHMNTGVIIFRGLQGGSGGGFGASLQVKLIAGLEVAPIPSQGDAVFAERPAPFEPRAMEAYYKLCLEMKGAYPARYNSFEDILDAIGDVASKVWSNVEPALVGSLSDLANAGLGMVRGAFGGRSSAPRAPPAPPRVTYRAPSAARSRSSMASKRPSTRLRTRAKLKR